MRVKFTADHDDVTPERTIAYKPGEQTVTKEIGEAAIAAGKAVEVKPEPAKPADGD